MNTLRKVLLITLFSTLSWDSALAHGEEDHSAEQPVKPTPKVLAPGYQPLSYEAPEPGTYTLPPLGTAGDGEVLTSAGELTRLYEMFADKLVVLSFIYTTCNDVNGCPLATAVLLQVKKRLQSEPALADQLRLVSLSFDPEHDTPEVMRAYGEAFQSSGVDWRFLTTYSQRELQPILAAYNQSVSRDFASDGSELGTFSHILRVFLIDRRKQIRNIYSISFLHADTLINDIKTLAMAADDVPLQVSQVATTRLHGAGDGKQGYESANYITQAKDLTQRRGQTVDLLAWAQQSVSGLPAVPVPTDNRLSAEKIALGRKLFYDRRLSLNDTQSCAICHIPEQGFGSNELSTAVGIEGRGVRRNAPTLYNVAFLERLFHDGREFSLEQQIWGPLLASNEMGNPSVGYILEKIKSLPDYQGLFEQAFDGAAPDIKNLGQALASYQRTLIAGDSDFDRWYYGQEDNALSDSAKRGFKLFNGAAGCSVCHTIQAEYALFTDQQLHNTGVGYLNSMRKTPKTQKVQIAPGVVVDVETSVYAAASAPKPNDLGLYEMTQDPADRWKYKTPSLRNIALTAPYMHDGSLKTLADVIEFYDQGGVPNELLDPAIRPLGLSEQDKADLVEFLNVLTSHQVDVLISDAFAAPIGDVVR